MENFRFFAILDENKKVINTNIFPLENEKQIQFIEENPSVWIYTQNSWKNINYVEFIGSSSLGEIDFIENNPENIEEYLNNNFPNPKINDAVIIEEFLPAETEIIISPNLLLSSFPVGYTIKQYSINDKSITNSQAEIGYFYDEKLNAFIPPCENTTYILNLETYSWEPNPNIDYDLYGDGVMCRWNGKNWVFSPQVAN
jgi:hypothetical protein